ncbi:MAG: bifunctional (p)ppGpp synthetase/guanosine-3',5'-bis(diphosphate) 3'-pyrophosphohydrolase [Clostridia bacterium]|nr:bifunctional (p)ppGpp synthetase/guanosine-3',5'-bis(diphosphate) 3'-pyrophosphohydrolase [Clostridia bacterium]
MDDGGKLQECRDKIEKIAESMTQEDAERVLRAYDYACEAHKDQRRKSGEPYIIHPVETACIIHDMGMDADTIIAGLLHDCIEDTPVSHMDIEREFGSAVADMVDGVTKLGHIVYSTYEEEQMENLRKMFVAMAKDIRVILIKLADRLHNMRTIEYQNPLTRSEKAVECMEIYAPLAHRLGMQGIKWELEDISLGILDPVGYAEIQNYLNDRQAAYSTFLERTKERIAEKMRQAGVACELKARLKHIYSIYRKLYGQNLSFDEIYDICATRVIVKNLPDCYAALGIIHDLYTPVPGRFKDYIGTPKPNGYQSLHTVVIGSEGIPFEVQIRTEEMDQKAEYGIAAHWKYKDRLEGKQKEDIFAWVRQLLETQQDSDAEDFIKNIKVDLFADEVYVFTPKGDIINLPQGATPIDFAYAIHSAVGNRMTGAKVNGRIVNIDYKLKSGEIVDVITSKNSPGPKRDWMQIVKTNGAKSKIRQWFKKERREENIERGKNDIERELKANLVYDTFTQEDFQAKLLAGLGVPNTEELYASIGYGGIAISRVLNKVRDESIRQNKQRELAAKQVQPAKKKTVADKGVIVEGVDNCLIKFAKCCTPIPGDAIVGFVTRGYGVSVHRTECPNVRASVDDKEEAGRWIKTEWDYGEKHMYGTAIRVVTKTRTGVLADVVTVFSNMKINVNELVVKDMEGGESIFFITVSVSGREQLELVFSRLRRCRGVVDVFRKVSEGEELHREQ